MGSDVSLSKAVRSNLLSLQNTASMMDKTQSRLATGNKVNSALDNPSNFFTASALNSRAADMSNLLDSMASGIKVIEAASNGITAITKNVESMQSTLRQARQDKSFQTGTYDVTDASTIKVNGGQFGTETEIKLQEATGGVKAKLTTQAIYNNPTLAAGETVGAQTIVNYDASLDGKALKVDGIDLGTITNGTPTDGTTYRDAVQTALNGKFGTGKYATSFAGGKLSISSTDASKASPAVEFAGGVTMATQGSVSFVYDSHGPGTVTVGGEQVDAGTDFESFVTNLQAKAKDGGYTVVSDSTTKKITLTSTGWTTGAGSEPQITGLTEETAAINDMTITKGAANNGFTVKAAGAGYSDAQVDLSTAGLTDADVKARVEAALTAAGWTGYSATATGTDLKIESTTKGARPAVNIDLSANSKVGSSNDAAPKDGIAGIKNKTVTQGTAGVYTETKDAASDKFKVTYGDVSADLNVVAGTQEQRTKSINDQLKAAGITGVTASFDSAGRLSLEATDAEAKTLAISGENSTFFGTDTVATGKAAVSGYNATNTVDKFVEEINRSFEGKLRASNDNGKLRIENLSTQELKVSFDKDGIGAGSPTSHTITGNTVRANLSKQFNELRDQLDKLADDSSFNGINLLRGDKLKITFNESGSSAIDIQAKDANGNVRGINAANMSISSLMAEDLDTDEGIDQLLSTLSSALTELRSQASTFGSNLSSVENRQSFTKNMINTLETGASNLTLADTNEEAANLLALQTRQQLSSSALSMASQQDQAVLQLLR
ncbi:hypothetical protein VW35_10885 [Devosia soli]|uniref:Flagellin n=1 Tax=Devosia soli TaxID=361041 RepID=A0A0F5L7G2_9HYPH|nr:flagellin [Devosia soli]KKB78170.1 hypothetical protein VW35_10885 [Devosia soli]